MNNLAIIPARGGSTRLKGKATLPLFGKPLTQWTIDAAVESKMFDKILLSSDSDKILSLATGQVEPHKRDPKYATTEIPVIELIISIAEKYRGEYDTITYLLPTCPFRNADHIKAAFSFGDDVNSVVSVVAYKEPIQLAGKLIDRNVFEPQFDNLITGKTNSLFMEKYYRPNGGIYMMPLESLIEERSFFKGTIGTVIMSAVESHDINNAFDMKIAEFIIKEGLI
jgi:CMP-N-acetylneuraminic acid synthetase